MVFNAESTMTIILGETFDENTVRSRQDEGLLFSSSGRLSVPVFAVIYTACTKIVVHVKDPMSTLCVGVYAHACMCVCVCVYVCMHACVCVCVCVSVFVVVLL